MTIFTDIADIAFGARKRRIAEHEEFLKFYRELVETVPQEVVALFGKMTVRVVEAEVQADWGILLTATDYIFWKNKLLEGRIKFVKGDKRIKQLMHERLAEKAENEGLSAEERKRLIALLEEVV